MNEKFADYMHIIPRFQSLLFHNTAPIRSSNTLNRTQEIALMIISNNKGCTHRDIISKRSWDKGALSRIINSLLTEELIYQEQDKKDRRTYHLFISKKGSLKVEEFKKKFETNLEFLLSHLETEEKNALTQSLNVLNRITEKLEREIERNNDEKR